MFEVLVFGESSPLFKNILCSLYLTSLRCGENTFVRCTYCSKKNHWLLHSFFRPFSHQILSGTKDVNGNRPSFTKLLLSGTHCRLLCITTGGYMQCFGNTEEGGSNSAWGLGSPLGRLTSLKHE